MDQKLLEIKELSLGFKDQPILEGINFTLNKGEIIGLVGDSGSGKSLLSRAILGLEQQLIFGSHSSIKFHSDRLDWIEMTKTSDSHFRQIRGVEISMIFQEPKVALNPAYSCGFQIREVVEKHFDLKGKESRTRTHELLAQVGLSERFYDAYPFQISGGEAQRIMIAIAVVAKPQLLLADEPTTSLDPVNEISIIHTLQQINKDSGMAILMVSHDEELLDKVAHRILYLEKGKLVNKIVRKAKNENLIRGNKTDSSQSILAVNTLSLDKIGDRQLSNPILKDINFEIFEGDTVGVVGNSGSGKSSLARCILQLLKGYKGTIEFKGQILNKLDKQALIQVRRDLQIIFQDPLDALNPRMKIWAALMEVLEVHKIGGDRTSRELLIEEMLKKVKLSSEKADRYPHQLSGGERQRACIARVLLLNPSLLILDEPVTSLDSSVKYEVLNLLLELKQEFNLTYIFISHDLSLITFMSDKVLVMKEGSVIEQGPVSTVFSNPKNEYTKALLRKF